MIIRLVNNMIEIHIKQFLDGHNQEKLEEKLRKL